MHDDDGPPCDGTAISYDSAILIKCARTSFGSVDSGPKGVTLALLHQAFQLWSWRCICVVSSFVCISVEIIGDAKCSQDVPGV